MTTWVRQTLLVAALLVLPLQGIAAVSSSLLCQQHESQQSHKSTFGAHGHHADVQHDGQDKDSDAPGSYSGHSCCHNIASEVTPIVQLSVTSSPPAWVSSVHLSFSPHIPEQPQRPPRG